MNRGFITSNTAKKYCGGVYTTSACCGITFTKTGGIITGYNSDSRSGNVVSDDDGVLARRGHAVYVNENRRKETTAGPNANLDRDGSGAWDQ